eukprot:35964-Eustigmatos_ZCMA.PRE.1
MAQLREAARDAGAYLARRVSGLRVQQGGDSDSSRISNDHVLTMILSGGSGPICRSRPTARP